MEMSAERTGSLSEVGAGVAGEMVCCHEGSRGCENMLTLGAMMGLEESIERTMTFARTAGSVKFESDKSYDRPAPSSKHATFRSGCLGALRWRYGVRLNQRSTLAQGAPSSCV